MIKRFEVFIIMFLSLQFTNANQQFDCGLAMTINPLNYVFVTRSMEIRIQLNSNCMHLRDFQLEGYFDFENRISKTNHPKNLKITIFGNLYKFRFHKKVLKDEGTILRKYSYREAKLVEGGANQSGYKPVDYSNDYILEQQRSNTFAYENLKKLLLVKGIVRCDISKHEMACKIA